MMSKKSNKSVPKQKVSSGTLIPQQGEKLKTVDDKKMIFQFEYSNWLKSFKHGDFTTYLQDEKMYNKLITFLFSNLIPKITSEWQTQRQSNEWKHFHRIRDTKAKGIYNRAIRDIHPSISVESLDLWQFGLAQESLRLICHQAPNTNILYPLLIDYHHLGYPSQKYNQTDYSSYNYCPIQSQ